MGGCIERGGTYGGSRRDHQAGQGSLGAHTTERRRHPGSTQPAPSSSPRQTSRHPAGTQPPTSTAMRGLYSLRFSSFTTCRAAVCSSACHAGACQPCHVCTRRPAGERSTRGCRPSVCQRTQVPQTATPSAQHPANGVPAGSGSVCGWRRRFWAACAAAAAPRPRRHQP